MLPPACTLPVPLLLLLLLLLLSPPPPPPLWPSSPPVPLRHMIASICASESCSSPRASKFSAAVCLPPTPASAPRTMPALAPTLAAVAAFGDAERLEDGGRLGEVALAGPLERLQGLPLELVGQAQAHGVAHVESWKELAVAFGDAWRARSHAAAGVLSCPSDMECVPNRRPRSRSACF